MAVEPILVLIVVAVVANLVVMAALLRSPVLGRSRGIAQQDGPVDVRAEAAMAAAAVVGGSDGNSPEQAVTTQTYDRVVRIVSWIFLLATTTVVAVTGLWPANEPAILVLLALTGMFVLVVHDLLPADALGPAKFGVEGSVAITVATLLVALTGGVQSPFFFTYPLIVGGAALVVSPPITVGLTATAALGYLLAVVLDRKSTRLNSSHSQ